MEALARVARASSRHGTRRELDMKLHVFGTAGFHPNERRDTACFMLPERGVMFDAGTGIFRARPHVATDTLDVFLSHAHLDHIMGLPFLLAVLYARPMSRVTIHGEGAKLDAVRRHLFSELLFPIVPPWEFRALDGPLEVGGGRLTHFPLEHPGGSRGYRLDFADRSMAYVTDTVASPAADYVELIAGVDLLVHECNFRDRDQSWAETTGHSHTTCVAEVAAAARVGHLLLVHVDPTSDDDDPVDLRTARAIFPNTTLGEDGMVVDF